jgi:hypothetical protein
MSQLPSIALSNPNAGNSKMHLSGDSTFRNSPDPVKGGDGGIFVYPDLQIFDFEIDLPPTVERGLPAPLALVSPSLHQSSARRAVHRSVGQRQSEHFFNISSVLRGIESDFGTLYLGNIVISR